MEDEETVNGSNRSDAPVSASVPVAVLVERTDSRHPWGSDIWRPLEVLPPLPTRQPWQMLRREEGRETYLADDAVLTLHRAEVASYRFNLESRAPSLFVMLRPAADGMRVALVTAAPDEAEALSDGGDLVEAVPMPADVQQWIGTYAAQFPPEPPMKRRKLT